MRFVVKDSGTRIEYDSGMRRDTQEGKTNFLLVRDGPMFERWASHLTKGAEKYGLRNWQLACSEEELERFRASASRHFEQWLNGEVDEDHAAAVIFNINAVEYVKARLAAPEEGSLGSNLPLSAAGQAYRNSLEKLGPGDYWLNKSSEPECTTYSACGRGCCG